MVHVTEYHKVRIRNVLYSRTIDRAKIIMPLINIKYDCTCFCFGFFQDSYYNSSCTRLCFKDFLHLLFLVLCIQTDTVSIDMELAFYFFDWLTGLNLANFEALCLLYIIAMITKFQLPHEVLQLFC